MRVKRITITILKYLPLLLCAIIISVGWAIVLGTTVFFLLHLDIILGSLIGILLLSKALKYCIWHRLLIYFSILSCMGMYFFLSDILIIVLTIIFILIIIGYFKYDKRDYKNTFKFIKKDSK